MKKSIIYPFIITFFALALLAGGCTQVNNSNPQALVGLHFHTFIDTNLVDPVVYTVEAFPDSLGRVEHLSVAQFYVTNLAFRNKSSQQWYTIPNSIILKRIDNEIYPVGNIPAGTYDAVQFTIGLGNTLNSQTPSYYTGNSSLPAADSVLSTTEQQAMFGSSMAGTSNMAAISGYTFMNVQGYDSLDHIAFSYQIGGYGDTVQITLPYGAGFTIAANQPNVLQLIHLEADYGKLLQTLRPINTNNSNSSFYSIQPAPANSLWQNIIRMFRYECPVPNGNC